METQDAQKPRLSVPLDGATRRTLDARAYDLRMPSGRLAAEILRGALAPG